MKKMKRTVSLVVILVIIAITLVAAYFGVK